MNFRSFSMGFILGCVISFISCKTICSIHLQKAISEITERTKETLKELKEFEDSSRRVH